MSAVLAMVLMLNADTGLWRERSEEVLLPVLM